MTKNELLRSDEWFCLGAIKPALTSLDRDLNSKVVFFRRLKIFKLNQASKLERQVARGYEGKMRDAQIKRNRMNRADDHYYD